MRAWTESVDGLESVVLAGSGLRAVLLPQLGGKIISLVSEATGREFVWRDPARSFSPIPVGAAYGDQDASGLDDCFPTVDPCDYPGPPFTDLALGDHGDVWSRVWDWRLTEGGVVLEVVGDRLPFTLRKTVSLTDRALLVAEELSGTGADPFSYQWTGHPLLRFEEGGEVVLPAAAEARTAFATGGRLAPEPTRWRWPAAPGPGGPVDVSRAAPGTARVNEKYWLAAPDAGCRLRFPGAAEELVLRSDPAVLPWLAVCVNYGGWPEHDPGYWVAPEPSTSPYDSLAETVAQGHARRLHPGETHRWWWSLAVEEHEKGQEEPW